jgi:hypothetical protein
MSLSVVKLYFFPRNIFLQHRLNVTYKFFKPRLGGFNLLNGAHLRNQPYQNTIGSLTEIGFSFAYFQGKLNQTLFGWNLFMKINSV